MAAASSPPHKKHKVQDDINEAPTATKDSGVVDGLDAFKQVTGRPQTTISDMFQHYYRRQGLCKDEEEFQTFLQILRTDLPTTFRFTSIGLWRDICQYVFQDLFIKDGSQWVDTLGDETVTFDPPRTLPWYPENLGWHFAPSKKVLRAASKLKHLKHFLHIETTVGNVTRQEAVSMIPPLFLDVQPHHFVLDMCAAPGSKTCQLIEFLHHNSSEPTGLIVANEVELARSYLLAHNTARLASQCTLITNYEAQAFPNIFVGNAELEFDRILADVPCTGDGTVRKSPTASSTWGYRDGITLHPIQLEIALRGVQLLKVGGRMVYSTCSFNPLENEAVVSEILRISAENMRLVDVGSEFPQLKRRNGMSSWIVFDGEGKEVSDFAGVDAAAQPDMKKSFFPPTMDEIGAFNLERCIRLMPHDQDTGGFFVAVLEKISPVPASVFDGMKIGESKGRGKQAPPNFKEEPFFVLPQKAIESISSTVFDFYGIESSNKWQYLAARSGYVANDDNIDPMQLSKVYLINKAAHEIIKHNPTLRVVNAGLKVFENEMKRNKKVQLKCYWRLSPESLNVIINDVKQRSIRIGTVDFVRMLQQTKDAPFIDTFQEPSATALKEMTDIGCMIWVVDPIGLGETLTDRQKKLYSRPLCFAGWRGNVSAALWIDKIDIKSVQNIFLTDNYTFEFDATPRLPDFDKRKAGMERYAEQKKVRDAARAKQIEENEKLKQERQIKRAIERKEWLESQRIAREAAAATSASLEGAKPTEASAPQQQ